MAAPLIPVMILASLSGFNASMDRSESSSKFVATIPKFSKALISYTDNPTLEIQHNRFKQPHYNSFPARRQMRQKNNFYSRGRK